MSYWTTVHLGFWPLEFWPSDFWPLDFWPSRHRISGSCTSGSWTSGPWTTKHRTYGLQTSGHLAIWTLDFWPSRHLPASINMSWSFLAYLVGYTNLKFLTSSLRMMMIRKVAGKSNFRQSWCCFCLSLFGFLIIGSPLFPPMHNGWSDKNLGWGINGKVTTFPAPHINGMHLLVFTLCGEITKKVLSFLR